jgi:prevent-host-death family protein
MLDANLERFVRFRHCRCYHYVEEIQMERVISAGEANRNFSRILRSVRQGHSYVVTSHGRPVARLVPVDRHGDVPTGARDILLSRLKQQPLVHAGRWTRDDLYEDEA